VLGILLHLVFEEYVGDQVFELVKLASAELLLTETSERLSWWAFCSAMNLTISPTLSLMEFSSTITTCMMFGWLRFDS